MTAREVHIAVARTARLYLLGDPAALHDIWIACHGYGQLARRFIRSFESISAPGRLIVAPEGLHRFYLDPPPAPASQRRVGASWMTREDRATDIRDYVAYLDRVIEHVVAAGAPAYVRAFGFSQGCATVFRWATMGATRVAELVLWSGEVPPDVDMQLVADRLRQTRITLVVGKHDELAPAGLVQRQIERLAAAGLSAELREFDGGHEIDPGTLEHLASRPV
jgi:predicted esterase